MPLVSVLEGGVQLVLRANDDTDVVLNFSADQFDQFSSRATQLVAAARLVASARSRKPGAGIHLEVPHVIVEAATATATTAGGGKVILSLRDSNGAYHYYGLSIKQSALLRPEMRMA